jgi:hypothetical protein
MQEPDLVLIPSWKGTAADLDKRLRAVVERLQNARRGSGALDSLVDEVFDSLTAFLDHHGLTCPPTRRRVRWSTDVSVAISLLTTDYNFAVGQRDGICWAWIQPNDDWHPGEFEARHDHPAGSGLIVAYSSALALTSATLILHARQLYPRPGPAVAYGLL